MTIKLDGAKSNKNNKTMKTRTKQMLIILILSSILALVTTKLTAQGDINVAVFQDTRLALIGDNRGNEPFTEDIRLEFMMNGMELWDLGYTTIGITAERAYLNSGDLVRYGVQGGFVFNKLKLFIFEYELAPMIGAGVLYRDNTDGALSLELSANLNIKITDWLSISNKNTLMQRRYNQDSSQSFRPWDWRFNNYIGVLFKIPVCRC